MSCARNRSTRCVPRKPAPPVTTVFIEVTATTLAARLTKTPSCTRPLQPVDATDPALAVGRVPGNRARDSLFPRHLRLPARLALELLVTDPERQHVARTRAEALLYRDQLAPGRPVTLRLADLEDLLGPVPHRDVLALPVDIEIAGDSVSGDGQVPAHPVGAKAEIAQRLEIAELDLLALERLSDDRAGDVTRILARAVVVEHA